MLNRLKHAPWTIKVLIGFIAIIGLFAIGYLVGYGFGTLIHG